jgi:3-deoxy-D-manno-octulosonate 8-phosphate phosphatase (KDO 8-P phosphatase)
VLNTRELGEKYKDKLSKIKIVLFDVDGILTDGKLYYSGNEVGYNRFFHTHDGYGLKIMMEAGIKVGIISGGDSLGVKKRFSDLGIKHLYLGSEDKRAAFNEILEKEGLSKEQALYMGDEFFDLPILKQAGFSATVPSASIEVREQVDYVTSYDSGEGCVREVIDMLRHVQGIVPHIEY